jgi:hypothetical protein
MVRNVSAAGRLLTRTGVALLALAAPTAALAEIGGPGGPLATVPAPAAAALPPAAPVDAVVAAVPVAGAPAVASVDPAPVAAAVPVAAVPADVPDATPPAPAGEVTVVAVSKRIDLAAPAKPVAKAKPKRTAKATNPKAKVKAKVVKRKVPAKSQARVLMQASGTTTEFDLPIGIVGPSCLGESVLTTGEIHTQIHTITSDSGTTHFTATSQWDKVTGTSTVTGKRFTSDTVAMGEATLANGEQSTSVLSGHFIYAGETGTIPTMGDDYFTHMIMHMTVSASGVPSAFVDRLEAGCR